MADGTKQVAYEVTADNSQFVKSMEQAAGSVIGVSDSIKKSFGGLGGVFEQIQKPLMALSAVVGGGAIFKEAIGTANELNGEAMKLSKALGITGTEAAALRTALGDIYSDSDTYIGAFQKFAKQIKSNEDGLKAMGLQTRDSNGNLRDSNELFREALSAVGQYRPGLDQTTAAMTLFGKGVDDVMALQRLNNDVIEDAVSKNEELGMTLTKEGVEASKAYKAAMNDVGDVMEAVQNSIGQAVMPVFTELGQYLGSTGPYVVNVFKGAMTGLLAVFRVVQGAVKTVAGAVFELFSTIIDTGGMVGEVLAQLMSGDFQGAWQAADGLGGRLADRFKQGFRNAAMNFRDVGDEVGSAVAADFERVWGKGTAVSAPASGKKTMGNFDKTNAKKGDKSVIPEMEAELEARRVAITKQGLLEGQYRELSKVEEAKFWRERAQMANLSAEDRAKAAKKASEAELAVIRQGFDQKVAALEAEQQLYSNNMDKKIAIERRIQSMYEEGTKAYEQSQAKINGFIRAQVEQVKQVEAIKAEARRDSALAGVDAEQQAVEQMRALEVISQQQYLAQLIQFEERRAQIQREALTTKLQDMLRDPDRSPTELARIHAELEALEAQHGQRMQQLKGAVQADRLAPLTNIFQGTQDAFASAIQGMLMKTQTLDQAMRNIYRGMAQAVTAEIGKMIAAKVMMFAKERILAAMGIQTDAAKAAAGAAASQAGIPVVGPPMAMASASAILASTLALTSMLPSFSAEGGFDIPGTLAPIVQTHPREMILPAKHADVIRGMAEDGGGAGGGNHTWNISAMDPRSFESWLRSGAADKVVDALLERRRNGRYV